MIHGDITWLVVEPTPLKNMLAKMGSSSLKFGVKIKKWVATTQNYHFCGDPLHGFQPFQPEKYATVVKLDHHFPKVWAENFQMFETTTGPQKPKPANQKFPWLP